MGGGSQVTLGGAVAAVWRGALGALALAAVVTGPALAQDLFGFRRDIDSLTLSETMIGGTFAGLREGEVGYAGLRHLCYIHDRLHLIGAATAGEEIDGEASLRVTRKGGGFEGWIDVAETAAVGAGARYIVGLAEVLDCSDVLPVLTFAPSTAWVVPVVSVNGLGDLSTLATFDPSNHEEPADVAPLPSLPPVVGGGFGRGAGQAPAPTPRANAVLPALPTNPLAGLSLGGPEEGDDETDVTALADPEPEGAEVFLPTIEVPGTPELPIEQVEPEQAFLVHGSVSEPVSQAGSFEFLRARDEPVVDVVEPLAGPEFDFGPAQTSAPIAFVAAEPNVVVARAAERRVDKFRALAGGGASDLGERRARGRGEPPAPPINIAKLPQSPKVLAPDDAALTPGPVGEAGGPTAPLAAEAPPKVATEPQETVAALEPTPQAQEDVAALAPADASEPEPDTVPAPAEAAASEPTPTADPVPEPATTTIEGTPTEADTAEQGIVEQGSTEEETGVPPGRRTVVIEEIEEVEVVGVPTEVIVDGEIVEVAPEVLAILGEDGALETRTVRRVRTRSVLVGPPRPRPDRRELGAETDALTGEAPEEPVEQLIALLDQDTPTAPSADRQPEATKWLALVGIDDETQQENVYLSRPAVAAVRGAGGGEWQPILKLRCFRDASSASITLEDEIGETFAPVSYGFDGNLNPFEGWGRAPDRKGVGLWSGRIAIPFMRNLVNAETLDMQIRNGDVSYDFSFDLSGARPHVEKLAAACNWRL